MRLVVLAVGLTLSIKDTRPVVGLEVGLGVDINLDLKVSSLLANGECGDSNGLEKSSEKLSDSSWAPFNNISALEGELGSKDGVLDGSGVDTAEGKGLVHRGALVTKSVHGSLGVDGNADSKTSGNSRSGRAGLGEVLQGNAGDVSDLRREDGHVELGGALGLHTNDRCEQQQWH